MLKLTQIWDSDTCEGNPVVYMPDVTTQPDPVLKPKRKRKQSGSQLEPVIKTSEADENGSALCLPLIE